MTAANWNEKFGDKFIVTLNDTERKYLALSVVSADWDILVYYSKTNLWYTRVTAYLDGDVIVKIITETKKVLNDGTVVKETYVEEDTNLHTADRKMILPLTSRGKPKKMSVSSLTAVTPFGCNFAVLFEKNRDTCLMLENPRANKRFPMGKSELMYSIRTDDDFHAYMDWYISTCQDDYFDKLKAFKNAGKVTVKYKPGDIFRMELDRTHYCYGIITGEVKKIRKMPELPEKHSLRSLMMVPVMVRFYQIITENPNMKADDLCDIPLGHVNVIADNDIIWGEHTVVDHRPLTADDVEFNFVCTKIISHSPHTTLFTQEFMMRDGLIPEQKYSLYIEWGFAQTSLEYEQLSDKLKDMLSGYTSPHGSIFMRIDPYIAVPDEKHRQYFIYRDNLLNEENREMLNEIFACLGLEADTSFDSFAQKFGGMTRQEIVCRL